MGTEDGFRLPGFKRKVLTGYGFTVALVGVIRDFYAGAISCRLRSADS